VSIFNASDLRPHTPSSRNRTAGGPHRSGVLLIRTWNA